MDEFDVAHESLLSDLAGMLDNSADAERLLYFRAEESYGHYLPGNITINLSGSDTAEHHVTHVHEIHHKTLNDSTAWGSALYFAYEYQPWLTEVFGDLLSAARFTHEMFATFISVNLAESRFPDAHAVLHPGGLYSVCYQRAADFVRDIDDPMRKDCIITALTRAAMQSPVLSVAGNAFPGLFELSDIPNADRPDWRMSLLLRNMATHIAEIALSADASIADRFGSESLRNVTAYGGVNEPQNDQSWQAWERYFFDHFSSHLTYCGSHVLSWDGHIDDTRQMANRLGELIPTRLRVNAEDAPDPTGFDESVAVLATTRFPLRDSLWPASLGEMHGVIDSDDFFRVVTHVTATDGVPDLVFQARLAGRLLDSYRWNDEARSHLARLKNTVVVSVKCVVNVDDTDDLEVFHVIFRNPKDLLEVLESWQARGPAVFCVAASCYTDQNFAEHWVEPTRQHLAMAVLLDVPTNVLTGPERAMLPSDREAYGVYWNLTGTPYRALIWHIDRQTHIGIYIGDDLATQLIAGQFADSFGKRLTMQDVDWSQWQPELAAVIRSIISCESFVDQRALESLRD